jgi:hypothetical protein
MSSATGVEDEGTLLVQVPAVDLFSVIGSAKSRLGTGDLNVLSVEMEDHQSATGSDAACVRLVRFFCFFLFYCVLAVVAS